MKKRLPLLLFSVIALTGAGFADYRNTNQLAWDKDFRAALADFFGNSKHSFYWDKGLLSEQVLEGLGGPPDNLVKLDGDYTLAAACRAHSCPEKAAVILRGDEIAAVALIHFQCHGQEPKCADDPTLTMFDSDKIGSNDVQKYFGRWAYAKLAEAATILSVEAAREPRLTKELVRIERPPEIKTTHP